MRIAGCTKWVCVDDEDAMAFAMEEPAEVGGDGGLSRAAFVRDDSDD